jgi:hypothetical protein
MVMTSKVSRPQATKSITYSTTAVKASGINFRAYELLVALRLMTRTAYGGVSADSFVHCGITLEISTETFDYSSF